MMQSPWRAMTACGAFVWILVRDRSWRGFVARFVLVVTLGWALDAGLTWYRRAEPINAQAVGQTVAPAHHLAKPPTMSGGLDSAPAVNASSSAGGLGTTTAPGPAGNQAVENYGERIRSLHAASTPKELREALISLTFCRDLPDTMGIFERVGANSIPDPKQRQRMAAHLQQVQAACQTIEPAQSAGAEALALRYLDTRDMGAAAMLARQYPEAAARVPRAELVAALRQDAYAGDQASVSYLGAKAEFGDMPLDERLGFRLALGTLMNEAAPSTEGFFGSALRASVGFVSPGTQQTSTRLLEAVRARRAQEEEQAARAAQRP
jgi:hypothetical protein